MPTKSGSYMFMPGRRCILAEVYTPFRVATQGRIYDTLRNGLNEDHVRGYLQEHAGRLLKDDLSAYPHWFNPHRYTEAGTFRGTIKEAKVRMEMYQQVFFGWSMYEVQGVFIAEDGKRVDEERTQVVRLIFKFGNDQAEEFARTEGHPEVYRAILYWVLSEYGHTDNYRIWSSEERERFLARYTIWNEEKKEFARQLFGDLAPKVAQWIIDCGLFIFGYFVREFSQKILDIQEKEGTKLEDQIWVTSIFHLNVNVMLPPRVGGAAKP